MAKLNAFALVGLFASLTTYYLNHDATFISYGKASLLGCFMLLCIKKFYKKVIWAYYTSPLRDLPHLLRPLGWKHFFVIMSGDLVLESVDEVPNDGLMRHIDMLNREVVAVTSPRGVAEFMQTRADDYEKPPNFQRIMIDLVGDGLITAEGPEHKTQRRALQSSFNFRSVKELYPLFWSKACEMVALIQKELSANASGNGPSLVNIDDWAGRVALDIIGEAGFGSKFDSLTEPDASVNKSYRAAFTVDEKSRPLFVLSALTTPALVNILPLQKVREKLAGKAAVGAWVTKLIEQRQADVHNHTGDDDYLEKMGHKDLISTVMKTNTMNTRGLVEQSKTFLGAGHETSATGLTWSIQVLAQPENLHCQQRLREEVRTHLPSPSSGSPITAEMLDKLPYLDAVSKEMLRLYPPVPSLGRIAIRDTTLLGRSIPKGTYVRMYPWAMNKCKKYWGDDGREFKPERWLEGKDKTTGGSGDALTVITFGHGPRGCIGKSFAQAENKALLASMVGSFEFKHVGGKHVDPKISFGITAKIIGLKVEATPLDGW